MDRGLITDTNMAINSGEYWLTSSAKNLPVADYSMMIVFVTNKQYIIQFLYTLNANSLYIRRSINNGNDWNAWTGIVG